MAQQFEAHTALADDQSLAPSAHMEWLKTDRYTSPRESDTLFWTLWAQIQIATHKHIIKVKQIFLKKITTIKERSFSGLWDCLLLCANIS